MTAPGCGEALPANPGEALWIGPPGGKNHFNVGIGGPGGGDDHTDYDEDEIEDGFSEDFKFQLTDDRSAVQFGINVGDGRTSSNTSYPRSELRELDEDGDRASWDGRDGRHYMRGRSRITHVAYEKPWVCFFQIHDAESDLVRVQTEGDPGRENIHIAVRWTPPGGDDEGPETIMSSYTLGDWIDWEIEVQDGVCTIWLNGSEVWSEDDMGSTGCYFKTGCYAQSNTDTEDGDDSQYFTVEIEAGSLQTWHTGYAAPTDPDYTGPGGGGNDTPPGQVFDLAAWRLTLPTGAPDVIEQPVLDTYRDDNFFLDCDNRMVMVAPVTGDSGGGDGDGLPAPTGLGGTVNSSRELTLTWDPVSGAEEYEVHEFLDDPENTLKAVVDVPTRTSGSLAPGSHYEYRVRARDAAGVGAFSNSVIVDITSNGGTVTPGSD